MADRQDLLDDLSAGAFWDQGWAHGRTVDWRDPRIDQIFRNSVILDILQEARGKKSETRRALGSGAGIAAKIAYLAGRVGADALYDGTRTPYWLFNHPLGAANVLAQTASEAAGLSASYAREKQLLKAGVIDSLAHSHNDLERRHAQRHGFSHPDVDRKLSGRIPYAVAQGVIPAITTMSLVQASGNSNPLNILGGGRTPGYQAVLQKEGGDPRETAFAPAELALRYIVGRSGRLLPWEEFTEERPDISKADYEAAARHQFDKGLLDIGLIKATGRNLEGEPEATMMGFRVPLSGAAAGVGAAAGGIAGSKLADRISDRLEQKQRQELQLDTATINRRRGYRKVGSAALGALAGAVAGNVGSRVINDAVIQPTFYPGRVQQDLLWQQQRRIEAAREQAMRAQLLPQQQAVQQIEQQVSP